MFLPMDFAGISRCAGISDVMHPDMNVLHGVLLSGGISRCGEDPIWYNGNQSKHEIHGHI